MTNAYEKARTIEQQATYELMPWILSTFNNVNPITDKGRQYTEGDFDAETSDSRRIVLELKSEAKHTGNLFLETHSSADGNVSSPGWLFKLKADSLLYYFVDTKMLYAIHLPTLQKWAKEHLDEYRQVEQKKYSQQNRTVGSIVPISDIQKALGSRMRAVKIEDPFTDMPQ